jgi:hypothetical protein
MFRAIHDSIDWSDIPIRIWGSLANLGAPQSGYIGVDSHQRTRVRWCRHDGDYFAPQMVRSWLLPLYSASIHALDIISNQQSQMKMWGGCFFDVEYIII